MEKVSSAVISLIFGFFQIQNDHDIVVDLLYKAEPVETSVGRFAMGFFGSGLLLGVLLCVTICIIMGIETRAAKREARKLNTKLDKLRERSLKDSG